MGWGHLAAPCGLAGKSNGMQHSVTSKATAAAVLTILAAASLAACAKRQTPPLAELPPSTSPAPPSPLLPNEEDRAQGELAAIGAIQTVRGWMLPITDANFQAGRFALEQGDQRIGKIATTLKKRPRLRVLIEAPIDPTASNSRARGASTMLADEVLRALTARGVDVAQIQAQARANTSIDIPEAPGVILIFSNSEGEFAPGAVAP